MQPAVAETTWPVIRNFKWNKVYDSMIATPLSVAHVTIAHLGFVARAGHRHVRDLRPRGGAVRRLRLGWGAVRRPRSPRLLTGAGVRHPDVRLQLPDQGREPRSAWSSGSASSRCSCSAGRSSRSSNLRRRCGEWVAQLTPLWHGVDLSRMFSLDHVDAALALVTVVYLVVLAAAGPGGP